MTSLRRRRWTSCNVWQATIKRCSWVSGRSEKSVRRCCQRRGCQFVTIKVRPGAAVAWGEAVEVFNAAVSAGYETVGFDESGG